MCWHFSRFLPGWYYAVPWLFAHLGSSGEVQHTLGTTWCVCQLTAYHHSLCLLMALNASLASSGGKVRGYDMRDLHVPQLQLHFSCLSIRIWICYVTTTSWPEYQSLKMWFLTFRSNWVPFFWHVEPHKLPASERHLMIIHLAYRIKCFQGRWRKVHDKFSSVLSYRVTITKFLDLGMKSQQQTWSKAIESLFIIFSRLWGRPECCYSVCLLFKFCSNVLAKF